jgi:hypothetical protein
MATIPVATVAAWLGALEGKLAGMGRHPAWCAAPAGEAAGTAEELQWRMDAALGDLDSVAAQLADRAAALKEAVGAMAGLLMPRGEAAAQPPAQPAAAVATETAAATSARDAAQLRKRDRRPARHAHPATTSTPRGDIASYSAARQRKGSASSSEPSPSRQQSTAELSPSRQRSTSALSEADTAGAGARADVRCLSRTLADLLRLLGARPTMGDPAVRDVFERLDADAPAVLDCGRAVHMAMLMTSLSIAAWDERYTALHGKYDRLKTFSLVL